MAEIIATSLRTLTDSADLFAFAFGAIGFVGGLVGYFAKGRSEAIIRAQAELIDTRDKQIADRDTEIASLSSENSTLKEANKSLKRKLDALPRNLAKEIVKQMKERKR